MPDFRERSDEFDDCGISDIRKAVAKKGREIEA